MCRTALVCADCGRESCFCHATCPHCEGREDGMRFHHHTAPGECRCNIPEPNLRAKAEEGP